MDAISLVLVGLLGTVAVISLSAFTLWPVVFWVSVIPNIEKRIGKKLKFDSKYSYWPLGKYFFGYVEVGTTIALMYLTKKIFGDRFKFNFYKKSALIAVSYDVTRAARKEIVISMIFFACKVFLVISILLMFLIPYMYPLK